MDNIRFSVHVPVYNTKAFLTECVESILSQSYENFELILTDDGSTDGSGEICDSFNDERVRVFHNENQGLTLTRDFSISKARGEYSVFIDSDDTVDDGYFEELDRIISDENCDMVVISFKSFSNTNVKKAHTPWLKKTVFEGENCSIFCREFVLNSYLNSICCKIVRTELLRQDGTDYAKLASYKHGEDKLRSLYSVFNAEKIVYIPKCFYNYRANEQSITHTTNLKKYESVLFSSEMTHEYFEKSSFYDEQNRAIFAATVIKSTMQCVRDISCADISVKEKVEIFKRIAENDFFGKTEGDFKPSVSDRKTRLAYRLFKSKAYRILIVMMKLLSR